ncbi:hypothetical protein MMYC01_205061 [Madurella mycetomatis]|uniref:Rhodopsin domain-containing protein n=1 Tax=Madurella mycetomatis TaxID=100816 RepID=A0A175W5G0_9PEZI|nr:hypothetical protein MMYC01_205061 [Madurella mycetomatis]
MATIGDNFTIEQRQQYVVASMSIGIILSTVTLIARVWARELIIHRLRIEDWLMVAGTILSYGTAICMLWGMVLSLRGYLKVCWYVIGLPMLGPKIADENNSQMIWIIQKLQPPTLFCIKASMLVFHAHIFQSRGFRAASWAVGVLTGLWMIASILGTTLQCTPIGLTNGVLSTIGDIVIYLMPIQPLTKLRVDRKTKFGLIGLFTLGLLAVIASILRWVALISANSITALNSSQVQVGVWTYLEMSLGIVCGNLPFLAPMFGCVGPRKRSYYPKPSGQEQYAGQAMGDGLSGAVKVGQESLSQSRPRPLSRAPVVPEVVAARATDVDANVKVQNSGFTRLYDSEESDVELSVWGTVSERR